MSSRDAPARVIHRPRYHVTAPHNWLNDPNGPVRHDGRYHLFYQYNPAAPTWGSPWWGHVSSTDLVHWTDHEPALRPRPDGPDRDGCWSGCTRIVDGQPLIFYTGVIEGPGEFLESVCLARGSADLLSWEPAAVPLIAGPPDGIRGGHHRDPFIFGEPGAWRMLIGSSVLEDGKRWGAILHYTSADLLAWTYAGVLYQRPEGVGPLDTGTRWECPFVFRDGETDVLVFSVEMEDEADPIRYVVYAVGRLTAATFETTALGRVDHGDAFYAPTIMWDDDGRVLMWGWARERHSRMDVDHSGALTLPRVLSMDGDRIRTAPPPELARFRATTHRFGARGVTDSAVDLPDSRGAFELEAATTGTASMALDLRRDGSPVCRVIVDGSGGFVGLGVAARDLLRGPLRPGADGHDVRLFVDGSLIELFVDDEVALTTRYYEEPPTEIRVSEGVALDIKVHLISDAMPARR